MENHTIQQGAGASPQATPAVASLPVDATLDPRDERVRSQSADTSASQRSRGYPTSSASSLPGRHQQPHHHHNYSGTTRRDEEFRSSSRSVNYRNGDFDGRSLSRSSSRPRAASEGGNTEQSSYNRGRTRSWGRAPAEGGEHRHHNQASSSRNRSRSRGRDSSRSRDRSEGWNSKQRFPRSGSAASASLESGGEWRCGECNLWNDKDLYRCQRCRSPSSRAFPNIGNDHDRRGRSPSRGSVFSEVSWFTLPPAPSMSGVEQLPVIQNLQAREWPPCFESDGTAFVFDERSGMFYEQKSDFFYDPKSKLYYGNKKGAYFRYDNSQTPPFVEVHKAAVATEDSEKPAASGVASAAGAASNKPVIAIKLKTKKFKKPNAIPIVTKTQKEQVKNIEKWTEKKAEMKGAPPQTDDSTTPTAPSTTKVITTSKGEPICTVCRRKFPNVEKLRLHEKVSELHKQNLAKLAAEQEKRKFVPSTDSSYQDRAKKRRELHGADLSQPVIKNDNSAAQQPLDLLGHDSPGPSDTLGESNVGHQLLQKMGWKPEQSAASQGGTGDSLRKDWDRIEAIARSNQKPPPPG